MNASKKPLIIVAITSAIVVAIFTAPAHAEWHLGASFGYGESEFEVNYDTLPDELLDTETDNGGNVDVFGQWRSDRKFSLGVHLGYGLGSGEYIDGLKLEGTLSTGEIDAEIKQGRMLDLLGVVVWNRDGVRPYIMLGPAAVELDIAATYSAGQTFPRRLLRGMDEDNVILTGYKLIVGLEGGWWNWGWHVALEYVDYGDEETSLFRDIQDEMQDELFFRLQPLGEPDNAYDRKYGLAQMGIRFGVSYRF